MDEYDFEADLIRRSLSNDPHVAKEAERDLLDIVTSNLLNGTLSSRLQGWLGHRLSAILDEGKDPKAALGLTKPRGRPSGCGNLGLSDEEVSIWFERLVLATGIDRMDAHITLADGLGVTSDAIEKAMSRARASGHDYRGMELRQINGMTPFGLEGFISELIQRRQSP